MLYEVHRPAAQVRTRPDAGLGLSDIKKGNSQFNRSPAWHMASEPKDTYKLNTMIRARKEETQKILNEHHLNEHASLFGQMLFKISLEQYYLVYPLFGGGTNTCV